MKTLWDTLKEKQELKDKRIAEKVKAAEKKVAQPVGIAQPAGVPSQKLKPKPPEETSETICGKVCDNFSAMKDITYGLRCYDILNRMKSNGIEYFRFLRNLGLEETTDSKLFDYFPQDKKTAIINCLREEIRTLDKKRQKDLYIHTKSEDKNKIIISPSLLFIAGAKDKGPIEILPEYPVGGYGVLRGTAEMDKKLLHGIKLYKDHAEKLFGGYPEEGKSIGVCFTVKKGSTTNRPS